MGPSNSAILGVSFSTFGTGSAFDNDEDHRARGTFVCEGSRLRLSIFVPWKSAFVVDDALADTSSIALFDGLIGAGLFERFMMVNHLQLVLSRALALEFLGGNQFEVCNLDSICLSMRGCGGIRTPIKRWMERNTRADPV